MVHQLSNAVRKRGSMKAKNASVNAVPVTRA